ncbi:hypothetical protein N7465_001206 [Penicillium sp. CMV-2018d]|nr:hypothetical protein N7465_001206 [Penicillium sp. CMV-2018d]
MDQPADAKKTAPRPLAPGSDAGVSLLRCPPPDAYISQDEGTRQKKPSPSDDSNVRPKKRKRDDEELNTATISQSPTQPTRDIRRLIGDFDDG